MNIPGLIDIAPVLAILAVLGGAGFTTSALLTWMRNVALNSWLASMAEEQRAAIYQGLLVVMNYLALLGIALATGYMFSANLLAAVLLGAVTAMGGAHGLYNYNQKKAASDPAGMTAVAPDPTTSDGAPGQA